MPEPSPTAGADLLDVDRLNFALTVALTARGKQTPRGWQPMTDSALSGECGVPGPALSYLRRHGTMPPADQLAALLGWLHLDPAVFIRPGPVPLPAGPDPTPASVAA